MNSRHKTAHGLVKNCFRTLIADGRFWQCDLKFVWNDVSDIPPKDAHVYNLISGEVDDICRKAFYHARVKAGSNVPPPKRSYVVDTFNSPTMRGICVRAGYKGNVSETCFPDGSAAKNEKYEGDFC